MGKSLFPFVREGDPQRERPRQKKSSTQFWRNFDENLTQFFFPVR
jgi:hypothetical protein